MNGVTDTINKTNSGMINNLIPKIIAPIIETPKICAKKYKTFQALSAILKSPFY